MPNYKIFDVSIPTTEGQHVLRGPQGNMFGMTCDLDGKVWGHILAFADAKDDDLINVIVMIQDKQIELPRMSLLLPLGSVRIPAPDGKGTLSMHVFHIARQSPIIQPVGPPQFNG